MAARKRKKLNKTEVSKVLDLLAQTYPDAGCALNYGTPFQLLTAVALSAQTTDKKVNQITEHLFERCPTAAEMAQIDELELQEIIRTIGLYKNKAKNLIAMSRILMEKYDGEVPEDQELLVQLPGVGRKTANVVMAEAFGHQRIAVDTHVFRVANRIGLTEEDDVLKTELALMKAIPENKWSDSHHWLIWHGRNICAARKPACDTCPLNEICLKKIK